MPAHVAQAYALLQVACAVAFNLCRPELHIRFGQHKIAAALVSVPEAAVYENHRAVFLQHNVGCAGQPLHVHPVAESAGKKVFSHNQLGASVSAANMRHALVALFGCEYIGHDGSDSLFAPTKIVKGERRGK